MVAVDADYKTETYSTAEGRGHVTTQTLIIIWIIGGLVGAVVGQSKGRSGTGFVLGLLLGLIGIVITALLSKTPQKQASDLGVSTVPTQPGGWWPDPMGRHLHRYWDGSRWTDHVADGGQQSIDLLNR